MLPLAYKNFHCLSPNHNPELRCVVCTGVTLFAPVLHFLHWCYTWTAVLCQSESRNIFHVYYYQVNYYLLPIFLACRDLVYIFQCRVYKHSRICYWEVRVHSGVIALVTAIYTVWGVPFISTMWPWKSWLEGRKHVKQGPAQNHGVINIDVLHNQYTCVANTWWGIKAWLPWKHQFRQPWMKCYTKLFVEKSWSCV